MFSKRDQEMIEFGRFTVYQSLKEMILEGDNITCVNFDEMVENTTRNICDSELLHTINEVIIENTDDSETKDWREELK